MDDLKYGDLVTYKGERILSYAGEIPNYPAFCYVYSVDRIEKTVLMVDVFCKGILCKDELHRMTVEEIETELGKILHGGE